MLLLCGMHHAEGVATQLEREQAVPLTPPRRKNVRLVQALVGLCPHWSGTKKALDEAEAAANERGRRVLSDFRKRNDL